MRNQPVMTAAMRRMSTARSRLILSNGFWGTLAMGLELREIVADLELIETRAIDTMATDATHIFFNPTFVMKLTEPELLGVLVHEVCHCADLHPARRGMRDPVMWNIACDFRVNFDVRDCGYVLPWEGATLAQMIASMLDPNKPKGQHRHLYDPQFKDMAAEEIYRVVADALDKARRKQQQQQAKAGGQGQPQPGNSAPSPQGAPPSAPNGQPGTPAPGNQPGSPAPAGGSGNGHAPGGIPAGWGDPGGCGGILDAAPAHDPVGKAEVERRWQTITRQAIDVARNQGAGTMPEHILRRISASLDAPRIDWRRELRRFTDSLTSRDYSWSKPNRRHLWRRLILPGLIPNRPNHLAIVQDTSGSVYDDDPQGAFASEIQAMLDEGACDQVTVIYADTEVHGEPETYTAGETIRLDVEGGGGTSFRQPLDWIAEHLSDVCAIVYLTDAETSDWGDEPAVPVLWAVCGEEERARRYAAKAPFGESLFIGD